MIEANEKFVFVSEKNFHKYCGGPPSVEDKISKKNPEHVLLHQLKFTKIKHRQVY